MISPGIKTQAEDGGLTGVKNLNGCPISLSVSIFKHLVIGHSPHFQIGSEVLKFRSYCFWFLVQFSVSKWLTEHFNVILKPGSAEAPHVQVRV